MLITYYRKAFRRVAAGGAEITLEQTITWLTNIIEKLKKENAPDLQIKTYLKVLSWLDELLRYRLFLSEFTREIELTEQKSKEELLKLIADEAREWRLNDIEGNPLQQECSRNE